MNRVPEPAALDREIDARCHLGKLRQGLDVFFRLAFPGCPQICGSSASPS